MAYVFDLVLTFSYSLSFFTMQLRKKRYANLYLEESVKIKNLVIFRIANSLTYFGLTLTATSLAGNRFLNFFFMACVEYISLALEFFMLKRQVTFTLVFFNCLYCTQHSLKQE